MTVKQDSLDSIKQKLETRCRAGGVNYSEIGRKAGVHPSQVSRICRGKFETLSENVVRVCSGLGIGLEGFITVDVTDPAAALLIRSVLSLWKGTPADASRIAGFLETLADLRAPAT